MWYKQSQKYNTEDKSEIEINNFSDRNHINRQIRRLNSLIDTIGYAANQAEGNHRECSQILLSLLSDKIMSTYPEACKHLDYASKRVYDAPLDAADSCLKAIDIISKKIVEFVAARDSFGNTEKKLQKYKKGLF